jgi:hypothetical protein
MPGAFRTVFSGLEPHGHVGRQNGPRAHEGRGTRRHRWPISEPMPFPRVPQGDTISVTSRRLQRAN